MSNESFPSPESIPGDTLEDGSLKSATVPARQHATLSRWAPRRFSLPNLLSIVTIIAVAVAWYVLTDVSHAIDPLFFPSVHDTWNSVSQLQGTLAQDAGATAWRVFLSWTMGCSLGIAVGLIMVRSRMFSAISNPLIEGLRPIPPIALIPFVILWFGLGDRGRVFLGALSCFMILVITTYVAARNVNPIFVRAAKSLGASNNRVYYSVILPAIVPQLVAGVRVAAALSWAVIVAAEYLGAQDGVGYLILQASHTLDTSTVLVGTITIGIEAFIFERIIQVISERLTRWVERIND